MTSRRSLLKKGSLAGLVSLLPKWAHSASPGIVRALPAVSGSDITLTVGHASWSIDGRQGRAVTVNGTVPGPLIRLKEGERVRLSVINTLDEETSIHWHGLLVPFQFDGVPGISFPGIKARETFTYEFPVIQSGTYWYHSHSGVQEQMGHYGPLVIDPKDADPVAYDREHVIVLSDYSFMPPHTILKKLKQQAGVFNFQKQTLADLVAGEGLSLKDRLHWAEMRMDPTDISDVTGAAYTYLVNGHGPVDNWTALFKPGERVRLRVINASAMTIFNVRIPGVPLSVVQADGQNVRPVAVDEFQIAVAETYDVVVGPMPDQAFTLVAEAVDRSGLARATLTPREGLTAPVPPLRKRPTATMKDMGMGDMNHSAAPAADHSQMDHAAMGHTMPMAPAAPAPAMGHSMSMRDPANAPQVKMGPGVQSIAPMPMDRTGEPGQGLEDVGHKVLVYTDLVALTANPDPRSPTRTKEIHLTGNMERFMWSFDGAKLSEAAAPIAFRKDERVRIVLVNDTMMAHPIHLHGHFFEVVNGHPGHHPRKHTVNVLPGGKVTLDLTADAAGDWALHCHLMFHMHTGMLQVVTVRPLDGDA
ncbi:MAG: copper resistance system multicopper oxidase [Rhodospirillaceae bacterium]|nr:copper resistance system multicopper oxidase [Rhodospirillaceae bacterium]